MQTQLAIGVFDSGMGGLTVLRALKETLPNESFIYLGDTARLPYGTKSQETVKQYALQMTKILVERRIKALVIACNTATTAALPILQTILPDIPVMGVIAPGVAAVIESTKNQHVTVFATETTIASKAYQNLIYQQLPNAIIQAKSCSLLVALAEEGMIDNAIAQETLKHYLHGLHNQDTLLLGCTHFPVFKPLLQKLLPNTVKIVDSAAATATMLYKTLLQNNLLKTSDIGTIQYLVTDSIMRFQKVCEIFLGHTLDFAAIELIDGC